MRPNLFKQSGRSSRAREVMGITGIDLFSNLFLIVTLVVGSSVSTMRLTDHRSDAERELPVDVLVTIARGISIDGSGPIQLSELQDRLRSSGDGRSVRVLVEPSVPIEREHEVLRAVMASGASVTLALLDGENR